MDDIPQFLNVAAPSDTSHGALRPNLALYQLPQLDKDGQPLVIAVEVADGGGNTPRNASSLRQLVGKQSADLQRELQAIAAVAQSAISSLESLRPGELAIEFGVELGGALGVPLVTRGEAKANFKVTLKWKTASIAED